MKPALRSILAVLAAIIGRRVLETADLPDRASGNKLFRARTSIEGINALQAQMDAVYRKIEAVLPFGAGQIWRGAEAAQAR